jgi:asparagine synthase (glutamine-hydrolysing)
MYFICKRARQDVKVVLLGQGPDELFGGYRRHLGLRYAAIWAGLPGRVRRPLSCLINALPRNETLKRGIDSLHIRDRMRRYQQVLSLLPDSTLDGLFREGIFDRDPHDQLLGSWEQLASMMKHTDELGGLQFLELRSTLPDELLMYADKLSMTHGLEGRVPYLDREIVEYVERLPASFKIRKGTQKWLHRRVCKKFLPATVLKRKKRGFAVNVTDEWLRKSVAGKMNEVFADSESLIYRFLCPSGVRELLRAHQAGQYDNHKVLFSIALFEQWLRVHSTAEEALTR